MQKKVIRVEGLKRENGGKKFGRANKEGKVRNKTGKVKSFCDFREGTQRRMLGNENWPSMEAVQFTLLCHSVPN